MRSLVELYRTMLVHCSSYGYHTTGQTFFPRVAVVDVGGNLGEKSVPSFLLRTRYNTVFTHAIQANSRHRESNSSHRVISYASRIQLKG